MKPSALDGFLEYDCDQDVADNLRAEMLEPRTGYREFNFPLFDIELFFREDRVAISDAALNTYADVSVSMAEFAAALPPGPVGTGFPRQTRQPIIRPPPRG